MLTGIVVTLLLIVLTPPTPSYACTCAQVTPQVAFARAQGVLIGTLTEVDEPPAWPRFTPYFPFVYFAPDPGVPVVWTIAVDHGVIVFFRGKVPLGLRRGKRDFCASGRHRD